MIACTGTSGQTAYGLTSEGTNGRMLVCSECNKTWPVRSLPPGYGVGHLPAHTRKPGTKSENLINVDETDIVVTNPAGEEILRVETPVTPDVFVDLLDKRLLRVTRALYDALSVIVEDPVLVAAITSVRDGLGDQMAIAQAAAARAAYETVYPEGLLPDVQASEVLT
jgi:hypothetical protein